MFFNSNAFRVTAILFILLTILLTLIKPSIFFNSDGQIKEFGLDYNDSVTVLPFSVFLYGILILLYLVMVFVETRIKFI